MSVPPAVLAAVTAAVSSPLVVLLHRGHIDVEGALQRLAVISVLCWVALRVVVSLAFPTAGERLHPAPSPGDDAGAPTAVLPATPAAPGA
jgi:hypothetical protein